MATFVFANFFQTTIAAPVTTSATSITVASGSGAPSVAAGEQWAIVVQSASTPSIREIMYVTAVSGGAFTVTRGQDGTSALAWSVADNVAGINTAGQMGAFPQLGETQTWTGANTFNGEVLVPAATPGVANPIPIPQADLRYAALAGSATQAFSMTTAAPGTDTAQGASTAFVQAIPHGSQTFASSGTFTVPTGVTRVKFYVTGGGGGGGYASEATGAYASGAGGAASSTAIGFATVTPGGTVAVTVGAGGAGGTSGSPSGGTGATSSFGSFASAIGGNGGNWTSSTFSVGGLSGAASSTDTNALLLVGGWGADGQSGTSYFLGNGGASYWGGGQKAIYSGAVYTNQGAPGGGGGGGYGGGEGGAAGRPGIVRVEW